MANLSYQLGDVFYLRHNIFHRPSGGVYLLRTRLHLISTGINQLANIVGSIGAALRQNPQMKRALDNFKAVLDLCVNQSDITDAQIKKIIAVIDRAAFDITQLD